MSKIQLLILRLRATASDLLPLLPSERRNRNRLASLLVYRRGYQQALVDSGQQAVVFGISGKPMLLRGKDLQIFVDELADSMGVQEL